MVLFNHAEPESPTAQEMIWSYVFRVPGLTVFAIIVIAMFVVSKTGCKGERLGFLTYSDCSAARAQNAKIKMNK